MTKRQVVTALRDTYPVQMLCEIVELGSSTYYYQPTGQDDLSLLVLIEDVIRRFPTYGYRRVTAQLGREGYGVNHTSHYTLLAQWQNR